MTMVGTYVCWGCDWEGAGCKLEPWTRRTVMKSVHSGGEGWQINERESNPLEPARTFREIRLAEKGNPRGHAPWP